MFYRMVKLSYSKDYILIRTLFVKFNFTTSFQNSIAVVHCAKHVGNTIKLVLVEIDMTIKDMYSDFLLINNMKSPNKRRVGMLKHLFEANPEKMRVVGITMDALSKFRDLGFKKE